jgi:hypothetical protein
VFPLNLYARVRFAVVSCTRDRGCSAHPVFPAPSDFRERKFLANLALIRGEIARPCLRDCAVSIAAYEIDGFREGGGHRPSQSRPFFGLKMAPDSIDAGGGKGVGGTPGWRSAMGIGYDRLGVLFRLGGLLRAAGNGPPRNALLQRVSPHRDDEVRWLLEENARLRRLAVKLSNFIGDIPPTTPTASS